MNASDLKTAIETVTTMPQYEALKALLERYSVGVQLALVDTLIEARERLEGLWAKTAPMLDCRTNIGHVAMVQEVA